MSSYLTFPPLPRKTVAVYLCCTFPEVAFGGRYPLSLPCGARTFLVCRLSACTRDRLAYSQDNYTLFYSVLSNKKARGLTLALFYILNFKMLHPAAPESIFKFCALQFFQHGLINSSSYSNDFSLINLLQSNSFYK